MSSSNYNGSNNGNDDQQAHWASGGTYNYTYGHSHDFAGHADHNLGANVLAPNQQQYGGFAKLSDYSYIGRSPITGLRPVIEQAIDYYVTTYGSVAAAVTAYGSNDALESAIANKITTLNDWSDLTTETQNKIMIMTGINFDAMSTAEQEDSINHLQHSPLPFGAIEEVLSTSAVIDLGYTHTLDKDETEVEHLGNGIYEIRMISNNGAGSHTGHVLGSFKIDMSNYGREDLDGQYATTISSNSTYGSDIQALGAPDNNPWYSTAAQLEDLILTLGYDSPTYVTGLEISGTTSYTTGEIKKIELKDVDGVWHTVWTGSEESTITTPLVSISFDATDFQSNEARVTLDGGNGEYEAIDAVKLLAPALDEDDGGGRFAQAKEIGNSMVTHTNSTSQLYLEQSARDILYGNTEDTEFGHPESQEESGQSHSYLEHVSEFYADAVINGQAEFGGYVYLNDNYIVGRNTITGLQPVVEQAIDQVKTANSSLTGDALERAVAKKITELNDWSSLTEATQAKLMIMTGINFDGMTTAEQEATINHLLHSPLPFGEIEEILDTDVKIDLGYTHTLDKDETTSEHLGDGIYEVRMISNNGTGSHTGHVLGSFKIDLNDYPREDADGQYAVAATSNSTYSTASTNNSYATGAPNSQPLYTTAADTFDLVVTLTYTSPAYVSGLEISGTTSYSTGEIKQIELRDTDGVWHTVWTGSEASTTSSPLVSIGFDATSFQANQARITIDAGTGSDYEAIDAVKLITALADDDGGAREAKAIEIGNAMVTHTNDNTKLYLDHAAREVLYGNVEAADFTMENAYQSATSSLNHIHGGAGDDYLEGTDANDHIVAGAGIDVIAGSAGNDTIIGGYGEYNQINYAGSASQYSFVKNHDGSLTVTKPNGTDTVTGVSGFWFVNEEKWYSADQLVAGVYANPHNATIVGSTGDDYVQGTDGNDVIDLRAGVDVVRGSAGNDTIYGGDNGYNQINYTGSAADYKFNVNDNGSITVIKPNGTDTLHSITGLWFEGEGKWYAPDQAASAYPIPEVDQPTIVGTDGEDSEQGTDGDDYFSMAGGNDLVFGSAGNDIIDAGAGDYDQVEYSGNRADYTFTRNEDGSYTVVKPNGTDTLKGVETIWFAGDQVWSVIGDLVEDDGSGEGFGETEGDDVIHGTAGNDTINALGGTDEIFGSAGNDTIDGGSGTNQIDYAGSSADYTVTKNENGSYTVVKPDGTDTLTNIDAVYFFGDEVWSTIDDLVEGEGGGGEEGPGEGDDIIHGTDGDDNFNGLGGSDEFFGSAGNDTLNGGDGTEYDQIDYYGSSSDYTFTQNTDGSYNVVSDADGTDLLINIEGVYFFGDEVLADIEDLI